MKIDEEVGTLSVSDDFCKKKKKKKSFNLRSLHMLASSIHLRSYILHPYFSSRKSTIRKLSRKQNAGSADMRVI